MSKAQEAVDICLGGNRWSRATVGLRRRMIALLAGNDAVLFNVDISVQRDADYTMNATGGLHLFGGNCRFDGVTVTTNGGAVRRPIIGRYERQHRE